jgi:hypothetical protein
MSHVRSDWGRYGPLMGAHALTRGQVRNRRVGRGEILSREPGGMDSEPLGANDAVAAPLTVWAS